MALLAVVNALLYRYTSQEDIIIGSPIAGREHSDLEDQIGFYVNTLALRTRFSGADTYQQLLSHVKQTTLDAYAHQAWPFDALMEELNLQRDLSRNALFDVMVVLQHQSDISLETALADLQIRNMEAPRELSKFDLQFNFIEERDTIGVGITYNTDIYDRDMMVQLLDNFEQLLEGITTGPDKPIATLKYLNAPAEQMILGFNKTTPVPAPSTVTAAFKRQAANTPDATALVFENTVLTYSMLDAASDRLAIYLRNTHQLKPGELAAIKLERSEWMIIALLGILKAGAAFVPIDPAYPQERIDHILTDSNCRVVIDKEVLDQYLDGNIAIKGDLEDVNTPGHLAYVIYTSGSTGRPKGVMVAHGALHNYISAIGREYDISHHDRILQVSNFAFDAAIEQIMLSIFNGAALYVISQSLATNTDELSDYISANEITHLHSVPTLLQHIDYKKATSLTRVVSAGENCPASLPQRVGDNIAFYNKYGPTEATISATVYRVGSAKDKLTHVPIGHPLSNSRVYILNGHGQLQPVGVPGEICIGGHSLAQGYLNQPDLTAAKFINDPYQPGKLMYCTGDVGKWLPDGNIVFIGRKDDQVKVRGHRIELGEITIVLEQHKHIEAAVVTAFKEAGGDNTLAAYIVNELPVDVTELRNWLGTKLPHYMVPAHFVQLDALPLLPNGKLNKKALPAPEATGTNTPYIAPRNEIEIQLAQLWQQVLGLEQVGVQHNFFELGGHSLNATRLVSLVQKHFGVSVNIKDVFLNPTIETVGELIRARLWLERSKNTGAGNRMLIEI
jgi:amino acid adenylation domain-containing protein